MDGSTALLKKVAATDAKRKKGIRGKVSKPPQIQKLKRFLAAPQGFEPRYADPESAVLPLNEGAECVDSLKGYHKFYFSGHAMRSKSKLIRTNAPAPHICFFAPNSTPKYSSGVSLIASDQNMCIQHGKRKWKPFSPATVYTSQRVRRDICRRKPS